MNKEENVSYSYIGLMGRFIIILNIIAYISRQIQFVGAEKVGSGTSCFDISFETNYRANIAAIFVGHALFFITIGFGWLYASNYIKNYEILRSDISELSENIITIGGCIIQFITIVLAGGLFKNLIEPSYADSSMLLWPICTFAVFSNLILKVHDNITDNEVDDLENKGLLYVEESSSSAANDRDLDKEKNIGWGYTGLTLLAMIIMIVMAVISRGIQYVGAEKTEVGMFADYYTANIVSVIMGHVIFFVSMGFVWYAMLVYLKKYKIVESFAPVSSEVIILFIGYLIMFFSVNVYGNPTEILKSTNYANVSERLWPNCTLGLFAFMFIKAHCVDGKKFENYEYEGIDWDKIEDKVEKSAFYYVDGTVDDKDK